MKKYRKEWVDDFTNVPVCTPPQKLADVPYMECDCCGVECDKLYELDDVQFCRECLTDYAWEDGEPATGKCHDCGCEDVRRFGNELYCKDCIGDIAWDKAKLVDIWDI